MENKTDKYKPEECIAWLRGWFAQREQNPVFMKIDFDRNFKEGSEFEVTLIPVPLFKEGDKIPKEIVVQNQFNLFRETLNKIDSKKIRSSIKVLHDIQGIDFDECIAYMVLIYIIITDFYRSSFGIESIICSAFSKKITIPFDDNKYGIYNKLDYEPFWKVSDLIQYWNTTGQLVSKGAFAKPDGYILPSYKLIPHYWLDEEDLKKHADSRAESEIPIFVKPEIYIESLKFVEVFKHLDKKYSGHPSTKVAISATNDDEDIKREKPTEDYIFRKEGDKWNITFKRNTHYYDDLKGFQYIWHLLGKPNEEIHVLRLVQSVEKPKKDPNSEICDKMTDKQLEEQGLYINKLRGIEYLPEEAKKKYIDQLKKLSDDLEIAKDTEDNDKEVIIKEKIIAIDEELSKSTGLGGKNREMNSESEKARINIQKLIKNVYTRMNRCDSSLNTYLKKHIYTGEKCIYNPDPDNPIGWALYRSITK